MYLLSMVLLALAILVMYSKAIVISYGCCSSRSMAKYTILFYFGLLNFLLELNCYTQTKNSMPVEVATAILNKFQSLAMKYPTSFKCHKILLHPSSICYLGTFSLLETRLSQLKFAKRLFGNSSKRD